MLDTLLELLIRILLSREFPCQGFKGSERRTNHLNPHISQEASYTYEAICAHIGD